MVLLGQMAPHSNGLQEEVEMLEAMFTVDTEKLKAITKRFVSELKRGAFWHPICLRLGN
jgi:hexokinase